MLLCHRQADDGQERGFLCPHLEQSGKVWSPSSDGQGCWLSGVTADHPWVRLARLRVMQRDVPPRQISGKLTAALVHFVLEYVEVVGRRHGDDVVLGVPGGVEDLLVEVQTVHADFVLLALAARTHFAGL